MLDLAVNGYAYDEVKRTLHYKSGMRKVTFRYRLLDGKNIPKCWLEVEPGGDIALDSEAEIKRTGSFAIKDNGLINFQTDRIKPMLYLEMQDEGFCTWPLGVFYMPTASKVRGVGGAWYDIEVYDTTTLLKDDSMQTRTYFPAGKLYVDAISELLTSAGVQNAAITPSPLTLNNEREWKLGTSKLSIINELIQEINYDDIYTDANGIYIVRPYVDIHNRVADYTYKSKEFSVLHDDAVTEIDAFNIPNVIIGTVNNPDNDEDIMYVHENNDPGSPLSIVARGGRRVVKDLQFRDIASVTELQTAVMRYAGEISQIYETVDFETAIMPHHDFNDMIYLDGKLHRGRYLETGWNMTLKAGEKMEHRGKRMVV